MSRKAVLALLGIAAAATAVYFFPLQGSWLDRLVSSRLQQMTGARVRLSEVKIERASRLTFSSMTAQALSGQPLFSSGRGEVSSKTPFFIGGSANFFLKDIVFLAESGRSTPFSLLGKDGALAIDEIKASARRHGRSHSFRIDHLSSADLSAEGDLTFSSERLEGADIAVWISEKLHSALPENLKRGLKTDARGWRELSFSFRQGIFTIRGDFGPLLQAEWQ